MSAVCEQGGAGVTISTHVQPPGHEMQLKAQEKASEWILSRDSFVKVLFPRSKMNSISSL